MAALSQTERSPVYQQTGRPTMRIFSKTLYGALAALVIAVPAATHADDSVIGDEIDRHVFVPCFRQHLDANDKFWHHGASNRMVMRILEEVEKDQSILEEIGRWRRMMYPKVDGKSFSERERIYRNVVKQCPRLELPCDPIDRFCIRNEIDLYVYVPCIRRLAPGVITMLSNMRVWELINSDPDRQKLVELAKKKKQLKKDLENSRKRIFSTTYDDKELVSFIVTHKKYGRFAQPIRDVIMRRVFGKRIGVRRYGYKVGLDTCMVTTQVPRRQF